MLGGQFDFETDPVASVYGRLRDAWLTRGLSVNGGVDLADIRAFQAKNRLILPRSLRDYLLTANGMAEGETDKDLIRFLSLSEIDCELESTTLRPGDCVNLVFAEYCVHSHFYVMRASLDGATSGIYVMDGTNERKLFSSFRDFIDTYLADPLAVVDCWR